MQHREDEITSRCRINLDDDIRVITNHQRGITKHRTWLAVVIGMNGEPAGYIHQSAADRQLIALQTAFIGDSGRSIDWEGDHVAIYCNRSVCTFNRAELIGA